MLKLPAGKLELMDSLGNRGIPFLFVISFDGSEVFVWRREEIPPEVSFAVPLCPSSEAVPEYPGGKMAFGISPVSFQRYQEAFTNVMSHLNRGDTYLINLTMPTAIEAPVTLQQIFMYSKAPYKLLMSERFTCFSPEIFVRIHDGIISSYPMKGTIDAAVPDAEKKILTDAKELAEHNTIVDLIRNDLSMVAERVRVKRYRYVERVETNRGALLQVSSEICGELPVGVRGSIGTIMSKLLPAGSVTGAPKEKTVEILLDNEGYDRGFYTGVFGWFDGRNLDSGVMIRFVEERPEGLVYKSGGGITAMSNARDEYQELIDKVYVPFAAVDRG